MFNDIPMSLKMTHKTFSEIKDLDQGLRIDESGILVLLDYINARYDCSDFRMICVIRSLYKYAHLLSEPTVNLMKQTVLNFKYNMADAGLDGMCFWSENHQLIFSTVEYLAGCLYPNEVFINTNQLGRFHQERAFKQLNYWFKTRFELGFVEFHSNTYYEEDVAPLSLLIDCSNDESITKQATILMDLLMLDFALLHHKGYFSAASGRCYELQKQDPTKQDVLDIIHKAFDIKTDADYDYTRLSAEFILNKTYTVPKVIQAIFKDTTTQVIKDSNGLYLDEVDTYFKNKKDYFTKGLYLWSMESFTNHESIELTLDMFHDWQLKHNTFLKNLNTFDNAFFKRLKLLKPMISILNPTTQGVAIQRANVYSYKHKDYFLSTAQMHLPKTFGDQQHIGGALVDTVSVFVTHPAKAFFKDNSRNFSPSYWVGNGIMPFAFQDKNIALYVYDLSPRKGFLEKKRALFTHCYFNESAFDQVIYTNHGVIGVVNQSMIGIQGLNEIIRHDEFELRQLGKQTAWAFYLASLDEVSLDEFIKKLSTSTITKEKDRYSYQNIEFHTKTNQVFLNQVLENTEYDRYDSLYVKSKRLPEVIHIQKDDLTLTLNLKELKRDESESNIS